MTTLKKLVQVFIKTLYTRLCPLWRKQRYLGCFRERYGRTAHVNYGGDALAEKKLVTGGIVKCLDLAERFPPHAQDADTLYLVSSALPADYLAMIRACHAQGGKVVLNQNGVAYRAWFGLGWHLANAILRPAYREADAVIFQSRFCHRMANQYLGLRSEQPVIALNPVNTDVFCPARETDEPAKRLLVAGSHHKAYRVQVAIEALRLLPEALRDVSLIVAGRLLWRATEEAARADVESWCEQAGVQNRVSFRGAYTQEEAPSLFGDVDMLVHIKWNDACPRLVSEALACGLPVIYSASGGVPELVGDAGIALPCPDGWKTPVVPAPQEVARAIASVYHAFPRYKRLARDKALRDLGLPKWLDLHAQVFQQVTGEGFHA